MNPRPATRSAFTLLEVLLAMALGTALLAALWSGVQIHLRAFDASRMKIEQSQVARALLRRIESDLRRTVNEYRSPDQPMSHTEPAASAPMSGYDIAPPADANASAAQPVAVADPLAQGSMAMIPPPDATATNINELTFRKDASAALIGTPTQLRLRICQPGMSPDPPPIVDNGPATQLRQPDDLQTIYYWLARRAESTSGDQPTSALNGAGFVRRAASWLRWQPSPQAATAALTQATMGPEEQRLTAFYRHELPHAIEGLPDDDAVIVAEEVADVRFRYLDGRLWRDRWNSAEMRRLPSAVEISLFLRPDQEQEQEVPSLVAGQASGYLVPDFRLQVVLDPNVPTPTAGQTPPQSTTDLPPMAPIP